VAGSADFSLASFSGLAAFAHTTFSGRADFSLASFAADAVFAYSACMAGVTFARSVFADAANFSFFIMRKKAAFEGAHFKGPADFSGAKFFDQTSFQQARFAAGATFLGATFFGETTDPGNSFAGVESQADLNFTFVDFQRPTNFEDVVAKGTMSFSPAARKEPHPVLSFSQTSAGAFVMSARTALAVVNSSDWLAVLAMIESSAKARDDLAVANDAHYERQVLKSHQDSLPVRVLDFVFYRTFAGYFVRPVNPLFTLLAFASIMTLFYAVRRPVDRAAGSLVWHVRSVARAVPGRLLQTLSLIGPARGTPPADKESRRIEVFVYRVLFACVLIGYANSNPTLRQMLDAAR
jgi:Pentapeptide repeats (9 copies)